MKLKHGLSLIGMVALSAFSGMAFSQSVTNGTFAGPTSVRDSISGWNAAGYINTQTVNFLNNQFGTGSSSLAAPPGGTLNSPVVDAWYVSSSKPSPSIWQTITGLTVGDSYTISFADAVSNRSTTSYDGSFHWDVSLGDQTQSSTGIALPGAFGSSAWLNNSLTFTATAASEVLTFLAQSTVGVAPEPILLLDNVSISGGTVAAVPEPSTYGLMIAGLSAVAWTVRRRKSA